MSHPFQGRSLHLSPLNAPSSSSQPFTLPPPHTTSPRSPSTTFNGPLRVLQELGADDPFDMEEHDPIARQIITLGEASIAFRMYVCSIDYRRQADPLIFSFFDRCHPNAPFLDAQYDRDMHLVRPTSVALFLNIVVVGARYWGHPSQSVFQSSVVVLLSDIVL